MGRSHSHDHGYDHSQSHNVNKKRLAVSFFIIFFYMIAEVVGGILSNSLALLSDAGHMLSDAVSLALALFAFKFGEKASSHSKTYGYKRIEILAAFINGLTLLAISLYIFSEAYSRFLEPPGVASVGMLTVAFIGLVVNIVVAWILHSGGNTDENLNMKGAFLHVMGDLLGSVGAIIAALLIMFFGWNIADPIASVVVAVLIIISGWRLTKDSIHVLMEGKPTGIDIEQVKEKLIGITHVKNVHDLHIWAITSDYLALSCHLVVQNEGDRDTILKQATDLLNETFSIQHTTIQLECEQLNLEHEENHCH